ncbi:hypothetical protein [Novosphingobium sp. TH158]|uniref:hypothetical protein n=1 Tax=Novosphingobium sp. TH158 TaxID=2067455 RepID=UPI000C7AFF80|nr:hypothetical protein [Novosphingobium sp. TH158]PLK26653.1 hypothetical protein C0V78_06980 [Novosphingobium sp. TH158]
MNPEEARIHIAAVAEILAEISQDMESLGAVLCRDPGFAHRHMQELQAIDLISQKQRSLAKILEADCPVSALTDVGLEEIVHRLRSLSGKPQAN